MREPIHSGKVSEAALSKSIAVSVVGILLCMICLVGTTWAWYSLSVESGSNEMVGANFDFTVTVTETVSPTETTVLVEPDENGVYTFEGGTYTVKLTKAGGCTATKGFCKVIATKNGEVDTIYYTVDFANTGSIEFTVTGFGTLKLIPMLGTPTEGYDQIPETGIALASVPPTEAVVSQKKTISKEEEPIDDETDDKEIGDSTDDNGTIESDEGGENVNENEVPDEVPESPEPAKNQGNSEPAEQPSETPTEEATEES